MMLEFRLERDDYLTHQLFAASQSPRIRRKRMRNRLSIPILYGLIGLIFWLLRDIAFLVGFGVVALLWLVLYPLWSRRLYRRHYTAHIDEHYRERFGRTARVFLEDGALVTEDPGGRSEIHLDQVDRIALISTHAFVHLRSGVTLILPRQRLEPGSLDAFLTELTTRTGVEREELDWRWR